VELSARQYADAELETLRTSAVRVQDFMLGSANGSSSLAASISTVTELLKGQISTATTDGVCWESHFMLFATVSHFPVLMTEPEVLRSGCSADLIEDEADAL
jgi:hypothetical protein